MTYFLRFKEPAHTYAGGTRHIWWWVVADGSFRCKRPLAARFTHAQADVACKVNPDVEMIPTYRKP